MTNPDDLKRMQSLLDQAQEHQDLARTALDRAKVAQAESETHTKEAARLMAEAAVMTRNAKGISTH